MLLIIKIISFLSNNGNVFALFLCNNPKTIKQHDNQCFNNIAFCICISFDFA